MSNQCRTSVFTLAMNELNMGRKNFNTKNTSSSFQVIFLIENSQHCTAYKIERGKFLVYCVHLPFSLYTSRKFPATIEKFVAWGRSDGSISGITIGLNWSLEVMLLHV